jgi:hypothetical protein
MPKMPIQDEPESTIGRKPDRLPHPETPAEGRTRLGAAIRGEEGDEAESEPGRGAERDVERDEPVRRSSERGEPED